MSHRPVDDLETPDLALRLKSMVKSRHKTSLQKIVTVPRQARTEKVRSGLRLQRIEEVFGWVKKPDDLAKAKVRGRPKVEAVFTFAVIAYNLIRIPKLIVQAQT